MKRMLSKFFAKRSGKAERAWLSLISLLLSWGSPAEAQSYSKYIQAVDEYRPAPGQWVNVIPEYEEGDTEADMVRKCTESIAGDYYNTHLISLGGWGGYVTFHFDHPVVNLPGQRDFAIWGNAYQEMTNQVFGGMNEAGIVMVSQDVNGNGLPDDPWYELSGSCDVDSVGKVIYNYEVTYRQNPMGDIPWTDNQGNSGTIDRLYSYENHLQEYYPLWLPDGLTFKGTRLPDNMFNLSETVDKSWSPYYFVLIGFRYGYADNLPNFTVKADADSWNYEGCGFDIGWAVDENRQPVSLDHIDFVRVYSGLNQKCPAPDWWGETSTEIQAAEDLHLEASIEAAGMESLQLTVDGLQMNTPAYDLHGRRIAADKIVNRKSLYIQNGKKYLSK